MHVSNKYRGPKISASIIKTRETEEDKKMGYLSKLDQLLARGKTLKAQFQKKADKEKPNESKKKGKAPSNRQQLNSFKLRKGEGQNEAESAQNKRQDISGLPSTVKTTQATLNRSSTGHASARSIAMFNRTCDFSEASSNLRRPDQYQSLIVPMNATEASFDQIGNLNLSNAEYGQLNLQSQAARSNSNHSRSQISPNKGEAGELKWVRTTLINGIQRKDPAQLRKSMARSIQRNNSINIRDVSCDSAKGNQREICEAKQNLKNKSISNDLYFRRSDMNATQPIGRNGVQNLQKNIQSLNFRGQNLSVNQLGINPNGNKNTGFKSQINVFSATQCNQGQMTSKEVRKLSHLFKDMSFRGKQMSVVQLGYNPNQNKEDYKTYKQSEPTPLKKSQTSMTYRKEGVLVTRQTSNTNSHKKVFNSSQVQLI